MHVTAATNDIHTTMKKRQSKKPCSLARTILRVLTISAFLVGTSASAQQLAKTTASPGATVYRMKQNDTLRDLSERFLGNAEYLPELMAFNQISNPLTVKDGAFIAIPGPERQVALEAIENAQQLASDALAAMAQQYAEQELTSARRHLDAAIAARWHATYKQALELAQKAAAQALQAKKLADERAPVREPGRVTAIHGPVHIAAAEGAPFTAAKVGDSLPVKGTLRTGPKGRAEVTLGDGSVVQILPDSILKLADYRRDRRNGQRTSELDVIMGSILGKIKPRKHKKSTYKVKTSGAAMAIRGTELRVGRDEANTTRLAVLGGLVDLGTDKKTVQVPDNFGSYVKGGRRPADAILLLPPPLITSPSAPNPISAQQRFPFTWVASDSTRFAAFHLELARDQKFNEIEQETHVGTPGHTTEPLEDGVYHWRVSTIDNKGLEGKVNTGTLTIRRKLAVILRCRQHHYVIGNSWILAPGSIVDAVPTAENYIAPKQEYCPNHEHR